MLKIAVHSIAIYCLETWFFFWQSLKSLVKFFIIFNATLPSNVAKWIINRQTMNLIPSHSNNFWRTEFWHWKSEAPRYWEIKTHQNEVRPDESGITDTDLNGFGECFCFILGFCSRRVASVSDQAGNDGSGAKWTRDWCLFEKVGSRKGDFGHCIDFIGFVLFFVVLME